ncbi:hypothetical protein GCM10020255_087650 [Rhodococcus baikonurensis]
MLDPYGKAFDGDFDGDRSLFSYDVESAGDPEPSGDDETPAAEPEDATDETSSEAESGEVVLEDEVEDASPTGDQESDEILDPEPFDPAPLTDEPATIPFPNMIRSATRCRPSSSIPSSTGRPIARRSARTTRRSSTKRTSRV